ncbi:MAG: PHP domain-containing protein [Gammaproteobacteria bacterium]|nr:PHP domain-containing protein [Gammaproteobacteria bacterium]
MQSVYDLHAHTTASDGTLTPTALVETAVRCGIQVLAVTDHDITAGLAEAQDAATQRGVGLVPGIEISVTWAHQTIHIVGLQIDPDCRVLQEGLAKLHAFRVWRAEEIARRLEKARIPGSLDAAKSYAGGKIISRTHFARFLVAQGYAKDMKQVFKRYLVRNKPGYVPGEWADLEEALQWIHQAGGLAVLAHPARYPLSGQRLRQLLTAFREAGGVGLEVVSGSHSQGDILRFAELAAHYGFYASRGSDYHGPENAYADPAYLPALPPQCRPIWTHAQWADCTAT